MRLPGSRRRQLEHRAVVLRTPSRGRCAVARAVAIEDQAGLREGTVSDRAVSFARETMQHELYAPVANWPDFTPPTGGFFSAVDTLDLVSLIRSRLR